MGLLDFMKQSGAKVSGQDHAGEATVRVDVRQRPVTRGFGCRDYPAGSEQFGRACICRRRWRLDFEDLTVVAGDTLSAIAKKMYGDAGKCHQIFDTNKPMLKDPDHIYPGQVLRIPPQA